MSIKYTDLPYDGYGPQRDDWRNRFPPHARTMQSAPVMGSTPIKLYAPDGKVQWGLHHLGTWREVESFRDPHTGAYGVRMNGNLVANPVMWSS